MNFGFGNFKTLEEQAKTPPAPPATEAIIDNNNQPPADLPPSVEETPPADPPAAEVVQPEYQDADILAYAKNKYGKEFNSVEEIFAEKAPVEKIINPWADVIDAEDEQYLTFKKETGRSRKEFDYLQTDVDAISALELARDKVRQDTGQSTLSNEIADRYIARELNIDLDNPQEIDPLDELKLNQFVKPVRDQRNADKEKYRQPIAPKQPTIAEDLIELPTGQVMKKEAYQQAVAQHQDHIAKVKSAVDSVAPASFKIEIDENGTKKEISYSYDYSAEDKQSMVSFASDPSAAVEKLLRSETGFDHKGLDENSFWFIPANREKAIADLAHKIRAQVIEEITKEENNVNFNRDGLHKNGQQVKYVPLPGTPQRTGFGQYFTNKS